MTTSFWILLALLVVAGGVVARRRLESRLPDDPPPVDDDALRRIEEVGSLGAPDDEPLDQEEIDEAERRFWEETWDEPEEL